MATSSRKSLEHDRHVARRDGLGRFQRRDGPGRQEAQGHERREGRDAQQREQETDLRVGESQRLPARTVEPGVEVAADRSGKQCHGQSACADHQPGGRVGADQLRGQQHRDRVAQDRRQNQPSAVRHEDPRRQAHQVGEDRQRNELADQGQQRPLPLRHARHGDEVQGHQQRGNHQQGPAGRFQLPTMVGVEPDAEDGRRNRDEDEELGIRDPLQGFPQADHQRDRRADEQQSTDQLAPANIALFHEGGQHLAPGPRRRSRRLRFRRGRRDGRNAGLRRRRVRRRRRLGRGEKSGQRRRKLGVGRRPGRLKTRRGIVGRKGRLRYGGTDCFRRRYGRGQGRRQSGRPTWLHLFYDHGSHDRGGALLGGGIPAIADDTPAIGTTGDPPPVASAYLSHGIATIGAGPPPGRSIPGPWELRDPCRTSRNGRGRPESTARRKAHVWPGFLRPPPKIAASSTQIPWPTSVTIVRTIAITSSTTGRSHMIRISKR